MSEPVSQHRLFRASRDESHLGMRHLWNSVHSLEMNSVHSLEIPTVRAGGSTMIRTFEFVPTFPKTTINTDPFPSHHPLPAPTVEAIPQR